MTVLEVIQRSSQFLARKGVDSPRLQVELLLAHVLQRPRLELYLEFDRLLTAPELDLMRELTRRRSRREPLQQIVGSCNFCGYEIAVSRHVLVPRPETEVLAEQAWTQLREMSRRPGPPPVALDLGTGSGCLAVALARKCPRALVHGIDISPEAVAVAQLNVEAHQVAHQVALMVGDTFAAVPQGTRYDLIVSNPPYIPSGQIGGLEPEVREYEPRIALDGGDDGLRFYHRLAREGPPHLAAGGRLLVEMGDGQENKLRRIAEQAGWHVETIVPDNAGIPRVLLAGRED